MNHAIQIKAKKVGTFFAFFILPYDGSSIRNVLFIFKEGHE